MPKNQFQRPLPVKHTQSVPRHGKSMPERKAEARRNQQQTQQANELPSLQSLLTRETKH